MLLLLEHMGVVCMEVFVCECVVTFAIDISCCHFPRKHCVVEQILKQLPGTQSPGQCEN